MALVLDDIFLPATLSAPPMTDDEFARFCAEHPELFFEMTAEGELIVMPPNYSITDFRNTQILFQLESWSRRNAGGAVTGPSGGFVLPNGARRSPDAAWTSRIRLSQLGKESLMRFWRLSPDFVIELKSDSDRLPVLRKKMEEWIANGTQIGWLINPENRTTEIFRPNAEPETIADAASLNGEGPVDGFVLDLQAVWDPLG